MDAQDAPSDGLGISGTAGKRRVRLSGLLALIVVCTVVAAFGLLTLRGQGVAQGVTPLAPQAPLPASSADWRMYHDPLGLFTMRLPPGWKATASLGSYSQGDRLGSDSGQSEGVSFSDPALGAASPGVFVYALQIHDSPSAQQMNCGDRSRETSTFNGYPAEVSMAMIFFESGNAHFQISETIPGVLAPPNPGGPIIRYPPPPTATPLSQATVTADKALLAAALASFQPTDTKPLTCP